MNILPKKRWHVRTKSNIARVRKDEAQAQKEEKELQQRIKLAEQEARTLFLRKRARHELQSLTNDDNVIIEDKLGHVNFFGYLEEGNKSALTNMEHEQEKKKEKEEYEKNIGLLTYLGQNSLESQHQHAWYEKLPNRNISDEQNKSDQESLKIKRPEDPLIDIKKKLGHNYVPTSTTNFPKLSDGGPLESSWPMIMFHRNNNKNKKRFKKKHKKRKMSNSSSSSSSSCTESINSNNRMTKSIEQLRNERLQREEEEKLRVKELFKDIHSGKNVNNTSNCPKQMYNSQFNPEFARQNYEKNEKYWL